MPSRVNTSADIGTALPKSDAYDKDNIFLTDEGWVYRHYKNDALTKFWDEIIVAGEVDDAVTIGGVPNAPVDEIGDDAPTFETGDGDKDVENSPNFSGGSTPTPPTTIGTVTLSGATSVSVDDVETYTATNSGTATGVSYSLSSSTGDTISGMQVTFNGGGGTRTLTVTATKAGAADTGATGTLSVTVSVS